MRDDNCEGCYWLKSDPDDAGCEYCKNGDMREEAKDEEEAG